MKQISTQNGAAVHRGQKPGIQLISAFLTLLFGSAVLGHTLGGVAVGQTVSDAEGKDLVLGMSTALSGPTGALGLEMRNGVLAGLEGANRAGGYQGRRLRLVALDDGYEPARTAPNMRQLVGEEDAITIIGNVGTPTAITAIPIALKERIPFFAAFTGAGVLRKDIPDRYVINFRASYAEETAAMVDALVDIVGLDPKEVAFFTQRDAFGDAGFAGGIASLRRHGLQDEGAVIHTRYERNTEAVENALADILMSRLLPRAVIMVGAYAPCAKFIRLAREHNFEALFLNVSFVGEPLAKTLGAEGDGVVVTQVVPHYESDLPIVREYRRDLSLLEASLSPSYGSLEGYVASRILCRALGRIEGELGRESITTALLNLGEFDIGLGVPLHLSSTEHQACHHVWSTVIKDGKMVPFDWETLK